MSSICLRIFLLCSLASFKRNLSLLDMFFSFSEGSKNQMEGVHCRELASFTAEAALFAFRLQAASFFLRTRFGDFGRSWPVSGTGFEEHSPAKEMLHF